MGAPAPEERRKERDEIQNRITSRMDAVLKHSGWDRKKLAAALGEDPSSVSRWLEGTVTVPAWFVGKFCEVLKVDAGDLIGPEDAKAAELERIRALNEAATLLAGISIDFRKGKVPKLESQRKDAVS